MEPRQLRSDSFKAYPPKARAFAEENLSVLQKIPLILLASILRQVIEFDWCFPAENRQLEQQLDSLRAMDAASLDKLFAPFAAIPLSEQLQRIDWVNHPKRFSEDLSAYLWSQDQIDNFHRIAQIYMQKVSRPASPPSVPRWTIVLIGQGTPQSDLPLFRRLHKHGTLFTNVDATGGLDALVEFVSRRARQNAVEYGHWYIEGGKPHPGAEGVAELNKVSFERLAPCSVREFELIKDYAETANTSGSTQVESITSYLAGLVPEQLGLRGTAADAPLRRFEVSVLTQGAGTPFFSTTFVQWAARECLRRAQPLTLMARFGTRQVSASMDLLMSRNPLKQAQDQEGSLVDANMGAYYAWIEQARLAGAEQSRFLAWYEDHAVACAIAPTLPPGSVSTNKATMRQMLEWIS